MEQCAARSSVGQDEGCILQWLVLTKHRGGVTRRDGGEDSRQPPAAMATKSRIKNVAAGSQQPHKNYGYGTTAASITLPQLGIFYLWKNIYDKYLQYAEGTECNLQTYLGKSEPDHIS